MPLALLFEAELMLTFLFLFICMTFGGKLLSYCCCCSGCCYYCCSGATLIPIGADGCSTLLAWSWSWAEMESSIGTWSGICMVGSYRFLYMMCMATKNIALVKVESLLGLERSHIFAQSPFSSFVITMTYCIS